MIKRICLNPIFEKCRSISNCFGFSVDFDECCLLQTNVIEDQIYQRELKMI